MFLELWEGLQPPMKCFNRREAGDEILAQRLDAPPISASQSEAQEETN
jgi:hypothetical protein